MSGKTHSSISCWDRSLWILSNREHSIQELRNKLIRKDHSKEEIEDTIQKLTEKKYIDEDRYFKARCRSLLLKRYGKLRIQKDLYSRGVGWKEVIYEELLAELGLNQFNNVIAELLDKKAKTHSFQKKIEAAKHDPKLRYKLQQICMAFLATRGYTVYEFSDILKNWLNEQFSK